MKLRQIFVALALFCVCCAGTRAQEAGEGQNLPRVALDEFPKDKLIVTYCA